MSTDNIDNTTTPEDDTTQVQQQPEYIPTPEPVTLQSLVEELTTASQDLIPGPSIMTSIVANMYVKQQVFDHVGCASTAHVYAYDHLLLLTHGSLQVMVNSQYTDFTAPRMIYIQAGRPHRLTALTDNVLTYSIHGLRDSAVSDDIVDPSQVPLGIDMLVKNILKLTV